jgi:hypothetical protein
VTDVTEDGLCINTNFCFPLNTIFELLLPLKEEVVTLPVKVKSLDKENGAYNIMYVEPLNLSKPYLEFANKIRPVFLS